MDRNRIWVANVMWISYHQYDIKLIGVMDVFVVLRFDRSYYGRHLSSRHLAGPGKLGASASVSHEFRVFFGFQNLLDVYSWHVLGDFWALGLQIVFGSVYYTMATLAICTKRPVKAKANRFFQQIFSKNFRCVTTKSVPRADCSQPFSLWSGENWFPIGDMLSLRPKHFQMFAKTCLCGVRNPVAVNV